MFRFMKTMATRLLAAGALVAVAMTGVAMSADSLTVGITAPDFTLPSATKDSINRDGVTLSKEIAKGPILLAFYPADWSGGCTKEMCSFRDGFSDFEKLGVRIWAISGDYVYTHHAWAKDQNFPFELLSDHDHAVAKRYGVYNPDSGMNIRSVFVVGKDGKLAYVDRNYSVADDADFNRLKAELAEVE